MLPKSETTHSSSGLFLVFPYSPKKTIQILPFNSISVSVETLRNIELILVHELKKSGHFEGVFSPEEWIIPDSAPNINQEEVIALAKEMWIDWLLSADVVALGKKRILQYSLFYPAEDREIFRDEITALTEEDLDVVMKRIAKSIITVKPASRLAELPVQQNGNFAHSALPRPHFGDCG